MKVLDIQNGVATNDTRYHGLVFDEPPRCYQMIGGCCNSGASSGPAGQDLGLGGSNRFGWDNDGSYADWYAGHEIGHGYGQCHPGFCRGQGQDTSAHCAQYPYPNGVIGGSASNPNRYYGFNVESLEVYGPNWTDMMTYCNNEWISDFTYKRIRDHMLNPTAFNTVAVEPQERLLVIGSVDLETDAVVLDPFLRIPDATDAVERVLGDYRIVLSDGSGAVLADYPFTPRVQEQRPGCSASVTGALLDRLAEQDSPASIFEFVPWYPGTAQVSIWHGEGELAERQASTHPPQVEVVTPNGGETAAGGSFTVEWLATDLDGDALSYTVLYSNDGGETWMMLVTGLEEKYYEVVTSLLAGSETALIRIVVSDGMHTVVDQSDEVFTVGGKPPQVTITWPGENAWFSPDDIMILTGDAYDAEDGYLEDTALIWESNRRGLLGSGRSLLLTGQDLTIGENQITLTATDDDG